MTLFKRKDPTAPGRTSGKKPAIRFPFTGMLIPPTWKVIDKYAPNAPFARAIIAGDASTGSSKYFLDEATLTYCSSSLTPSATGYSSATTAHWEAARGSVLAAITTSSTSSSDAFTIPSSASNGYYQLMIVDGTNAAYATVQVNC